MDKSQLVLDIVGTQLNSLGFTKTFEDEEEWVFKKIEGYLEQKIIITDRYHHGIGIFLQTNVPQDGIIKTLSAKDIMPKSEYNGDKSGFFLYRSETEFCELMKRFKQIIIDFGMEALHRLSTPLPKGRITKDAENFLYINHSSLAEEFAKQLNINISDLEQDLDNIQIITNRIVILKNKEFHLIEQELVGLAALYGTLFEKKLHWEWSLHPAIGCYVTDFFYNRVQPLHDIFTMWDHRTENSLMMKYQEMLIKDQNKMNVDTPGTPSTIIVDNPQTRQEKLQFLELKKGYGYALELSGYSDENIDKLFQELYPILKDKKDCFGDPYCIRCDSMADVGKDIVCECGINRAVYDEADWKEDIEMHTEHLPADKKFIKNGYRIKR